VDGEQPGPAAAARPKSRVELGALTQPGRCRQHVAQAESRVRPLVRRAPRIERPARVRMRRRKPWVLARRRLFGWKVRLLTRRLLAIGTSGFRYFSYSTSATRLSQNSVLAQCAARGTTYLRQRLLSNVGGCGRSVAGRRTLPPDAQPPTVHRPGTVDNLEAGTQHRAVGDSTAPRYVSVAGAVKPARDANHPVSRAEVGNGPTDTPDPTKNVLRVVDNRLLRGPPGE
jgi:hypothetical protein